VFLFVRCLLLVFGCEGGVIFVIVVSGMLIFFLMVVLFSVVVFGVEGLVVDVIMVVGNGYVFGYVDVVFEIVCFIFVVCVLFEWRL